MTMLDEKYKLKFARYISNIASEKPDDEIVPDYFVENELRNWLNDKFLLDPPLQPKRPSDKVDDLPFNEIVKEGYKIRTFDPKTNSGELKWHFDLKDRKVYILEGNNWFLQMDNQIPKKLIVGESIYIPKGVYHRVIKGDGNLKIKIKEF